MTASDLSDAIAVPPARYDGATPGQIMCELLDAAHARGTLTDVTAGFDADHDSDGKPWATVVTLSCAWARYDDVGAHLGLDEVSINDGVLYARS